MTDEQTLQIAAAAAPTPTPVRRLFTATLIIGPPGSGKTSQFAAFSAYLWETFGKILLLYSWDGGAIPTDVQKRMKQGLIRFWRARTRSAEGVALETLYLATRGYWPRRINAETGETSPGVDLVPPVTAKYSCRCSKGHDLATVPTRSLVVPMFCTPCGAFVPLSEMQVSESVTRTKGFELVGGVGFDGLTSMTNEVLDHMDLQRGAGQIGGEKSSFGGVVTSGSIKFGGTNRADIGFGQSRGRQFVNNALTIPNLVEGPVFTALTDETTDEGNLTVVGAKLPGHAVTGEASGWFGNVCEQGRWIDDEGKSHYCLYVRPFTDKENRRHLLKTSGTVFGIPDKLIDPPEDQKQPFKGASLGILFKMLDEDLRVSLQEELPGAPGMPSGIQEYGESLSVQQPGQSPTVVGAMPMPLTPPTPAPAAAQQAAPAGVQSGLMVARPRAKKGNGQTQPIAPPTTAVAAPAPAVQAPAAVPPAAQPPPVPPPAATVAGSQAAVPPPPPGMKPPQRAPGT